MRSLLVTCVVFGVGFVLINVVPLWAIVFFATWFLIALSNC